MHTYIYITKGYNTADSGLLKDRNIWWRVANGPLRQEIQTHHCNLLRLVGNGARVWLGKERAIPIPFWGRLSPLTLTLKPKLTLLSWLYSPQNIFIILICYTNVCVGILTHLPTWLFGVSSATILLQLWHLYLLFYNPLPTWEYRLGIYRYVDIGDINSIYR